MRFLKKLFVKENHKINLLAEQITAIQQYLLPALNPQHFDYKVSFFKTAIKFRTDSTYSEQEMKKLTQLSSIQLLKRTRRDSYWKASFNEYQMLYSNQRITFVSDALEPFKAHIIELGQEIEHFETLLKYEVTIENVRQVLESAIARNGIIDPVIEEESRAILTHIIDAFYKELHENEMENQATLVDQLKFEQKFMNKQ